MKTKNGNISKLRRMCTFENIAIMFFWLWSILMLLIVAVNLNAGLGFSSFIISLIYLILLILVVKFRKKILIFLKKHQKGTMIICAIMIIGGILLRFGLVLAENNFYVEPILSDTGVHWQGSAQLVETGQLNKDIGEYEGIFPYLTTYTGTLALAMNVFGVGFKAVVLSNTFFDIISMILIFMLFTLWKSNKKAGLMAATIWAINPLQIIFCSLPMAIVVTNTMILLVIFLAYLLFRYGREKLWLGLLLFGLCGINLAIGNAFRPLFTVFMIAIIIFELCLVIRKKVKVVHVALGVVMMLLGFGLTNNVLSNRISSINPYYAMGGGNNIGWSFFVGANYETGGRWSANDRDVFFGQILESTNNDVQAAQKVIFLKGGERYIDMLTHGQLLDHMMNKTAVVFADVKNSIGDFRDDFQVEEQNDVRYQVLLNIILIYYYSLVSVLVCFMIWAYKNKVKQYCAKNQFFVFAMITFVGLFAASMLVEVMNRYSLPFIAMLVIFAVNAIWDMSSKVAVKY